VGARQRRQRHDHCRCAAGPYGIVGGLRGCVVVTDEFVDGVPVSLAIGKVDMGDVDVEHSRHSSAIGCLDGDDAD
jgi:hypothetical protein